LSQEKPRNLAASIHRRLLTLAQKSGEDFGFTLTRYALERLLYRLGRSPHADAFVLKGAMLFQAWTSHPHRPTRDVDFLGRGEYSLSRFKAIFSEILSGPFEDDAVRFLPETIRVETMKDEEEYPGLRVLAEAYLGKARIGLQIDIGFGDAITPAPVVMDYPTLLPLPAPRLATYPVESVVSEKLEAMVKLGIANSRMKDFFDLWVLAREFSFTGDVLRAAVRATFERRKTEIPDAVPLAFTSEFYGDPAKNAQWQAFTKRNSLPAGTLSDTIGALSAFLCPVLQAVHSKQSFTQRWTTGGPWLP
jgi:predicted nucleotidyltransferase component of viral defense system